MDIKAIVVGEITKQAEASVPQLKKAINCNELNQTNNNGLKVITRVCLVRS